MLCINVSGNPCKQFGFTFWIHGINVFNLSINKILNFAGS